MIKGFLVKLILKRSTQKVEVGTGNMNIETIQMCNDMVRKAKAHLESDLAADVKGNKKGSHKYTSSKED